ncbi:lipocalin family protein [Flavobacterium sp. LC2016-01]|uniref:lipocalin family protein n=1 Tax=Flavobacterium sp. LC2016-01 TaxID=2675876 RepID=UPI0012BAAA4E|nr:lipocalin family protein [Flavobacterium sp. LC2016-01]MTH16500.1 hypothetical protein [Flavobacterium sp. LC2016-01]
MKKLIVLFVFALFQVSCNSDNEPKVKNTGIIGTWKLTGHYVSAGGPSNWIPADDSYTYTFNSDGSFTSTRFPECKAGTYKTDTKTLTLVYGCPGFTTTMEKPAGTFIENYTIEDKQMYFYHVNYMRCIEECSDVFTKIK